MPTLIYRLSGASVEVSEDEVKELVASGHWDAAKAAPKPAPPRKAAARKPQEG